MVGNLLFLVYRLLDELSPLRRCKKFLDLFGFIFQYLPSILDLFTFFYFSIFIAIYDVTNPTIDVYEVNNERHMSK